MANTAELYDMSGNVREWCFDLYLSSGTDRVQRGGGWNDGASHCSVFYRDDRSSTGSAYYYLGFRLVCR
jgi:formylglycine-generating enzyme required for sulfatase activity